MPPPEVAAPKIAEELPTDLDIAEKEAEQRRVAALSDLAGAQPAPNLAPAAEAEPAVAPTASPAPAASPAATPNEPAPAASPAASPPMSPESSASGLEPPAAPNVVISPAAEAAPPPPPEPVKAIPLPEEGPKSSEEPPALALSSPPEQPPASDEKLLSLSGQGSRSEPEGSNPAGPETSPLPESATSDHEAAGEPVSPTSATETAPPASSEAPVAEALPTRTPMPELGETEQVAPPPSGVKPPGPAVAPAPPIDRGEGGPGPTPTPPSETLDSTPPAPAIALALPPNPPPSGLPSREETAPPADAAGARPETVGSPVPGSPSEPLSLAAEEEESPIVRGFGGSKALLGEWSVTDEAARQLDKDAFFAKLAAPLVQEAKPYRYSFVAASEARGRGWVGLGATVFVPSSGLVKGYGSGNALLVWLTRDPVHFAKDITRLQIYRSVNEWKMLLVAEIPVSESIYDENRFEISLDPGAGTISVSLNGKHNLTASGLEGLEAGSYVVFRSLDRASFGDFAARRDGTGADR